MNISLTPILVLAILPMMIFTFKQIATWVGNEGLRRLITPLVTISIMAIPLGIFVNFWTPYNLLIVIALIYCLNGDLYLMNDDEKNFRKGLISFGAAQILFIIAFISIGTFNTPLAFYGGISLCGLFIAIIGFGRLYKQLLILGYLFVLLGMVFTSLFTTPLIIVGAVLFLLSDFLILVNIVRPFPHASFWVWMLYAPAIFLMAVSGLYII